MMAYVTTAVYVLNGALVGIFGMVLSASFCDIVWTAKKRLIMAGSMAAILLLQGGLSLWLEPTVIPYLYPFITHLPLVLVLCLLNGKLLWPVVSVLTAYLCCQLRRWLALLAVVLVSDGELVQEVTELVVTVPLLLLLLHFVSPAVRTVSRETSSVQFRFGLIPALGYGFDYFTRIYTDLLSKGSPAAVEFMPFVCSVAYLVFVLRTSEEKQVRSRLEQTQATLNLQVSQAVREIEALRKSDRRAAAYRHDLRHHMQYLAACIENGRTEQAQTYIKGICSEIEAQKVTVFCENEAANLIFSAFAGRAKEQGVPISIAARIPQNLSIEESDLCVLLSNALENALHACAKIVQRGQSAGIEVSAYEKSGQFFLQVINPCDEEVTFSEGIPVTYRPGHGIGVRSICAIAERYGGIYAFSAKDGRFVLRVSLFTVD